MYAYDRKREQDIAEKKSGGARKKEGSIQRKSSRADQTVRAENRTGIPTQMKERMEYHTGFSLDDVRVHYHSDMPKRLDALAYTQGNQVYLGAGQERHLPHELGHVVQQKLGKVKADTRHESGVMMNTDVALEREADEIGALRKTAGGRGGSAGAVQRKIDPESEALDDGALIGAVRARMRKKYKPVYEKETRNFYRLIKKSSYPFTNDEILDRIIASNWNKAGTGRILFEEMESEKQKELDLRYGGERGHMVSRHIEISDKELGGRVTGERGIERASRFAPTVKGKDQALHTLERLQPVLETLLRDVMQMAGSVLVQDMQQIRGMGIAQVKQYLSRTYGIDFDTEIEEKNGEFDISYHLLLQKSNAGGAGPVFTLSIDYSVQVDRIFQKQVMEKGRTGKVKRVYETAEVHRGRNKPAIQVTPATTAGEIDGLVEESGIDIVGVTFY